MKNINRIDHKKLSVFFDFDNTITTHDVIDDMLLKFSVDNKWQNLEDRWKKGEIGSRECLEGQIKGISITKEKLDKYLAGVKIDPYFKKLRSLFASKDIDTVILSDNFDYILKAILENNGISDMKIYSNKVRIEKDRLEPSFLFGDEKCETCAHCKRNNLLTNTKEDFIVAYIGDGRSDICPSEHSDIVFAKEDLLKHFTENNLPCIPCKNLKDVYDYFKKRLS